VEIVVSGRHTEVPDRFRRLAEEKLVKVGQLAPKAHRTDVELSHEKNPRRAQTCEKVEITVRGKGPVIRAEASAEDPATALDIAFGKLLERLRRHRDRRKVHHGRQTPPSLRVTGAEPAAGATVPDGEGLDGAGLEPAALDGAALEGDVLDGGSFAASAAAGGREAGVPELPALAAASPIVIRTKDHEAAPMSLDQALYEMELVGHDFYLFVDADTGRPSVVYRRRGWSYGVIRLTVTADLPRVDQAVRVDQAIPGRSTHD
jgi:ribosomal subunit interface protein